MAQASIILLPVGTLPVKDILAMLGWVVSNCPVFVSPWKDNIRFHNRFVLYYLLGCAHLYSIYLVNHDHHTIYILYQVVEKEGMSIPVYTCTRNILVYDLDQDSNWALATLVKSSITELLRPISRSTV